MAARLRLPLRLPGVHAGEDDRALLGRFAADRDEAAFASLVRRYGVMVLGVCRRAVGDAHLAEDAFQATFLVLARNPAAAAGASSVAGWLFGVARRVGLAARLFAGVLAPSATAAVPVFALDRPVPPSVERLAAAGLGGVGAAKVAVALGVLLLGGLAAGLGWAAVPNAAAPAPVFPTAAP